MVFVNKIVGDGGSQPNYEIIAPGEQVYGRGNHRQPVGPDVLRFAHRCGNGQFRLVVKFMEFRDGCQGGFHVWVMVNNRREDGFGRPVLPDQALYGVIVVIFQDDQVLEVVTFEYGTLKPGIAKVEAQGCLRQWVNFILHEYIKEDR